MNRRTLITSGTAVLVAALVAALATWPGTASAAKAPLAAPRVTIARAPFVPVGGEVDLGVSVVVPAEARGLKVRVRLYDRDDRMLWQKTQTRSALQPSTVVLGFNKAADELGLTEGRYRLQVAVSLTGMSDAVLDERVYVIDRGREPIPVSLVARWASPSARDPEGRFVVDPAVDDSGRAQLDSLARLSLLRPELRLTAALPPVLLDEWRDLADGYDLAGAAGVVSYGADTTTAIGARAGIEALSRAIGSGSLGSLRTLYAEPDLLETDRIGRGDVAGQLELGSRVASAALSTADASRSVIPTGFAVLGDRLTATATAVLARSGVTYALVGTDSVRPPASGPRAPGIYRVDGAGAVFTAVVVDRTAARCISDGRGPSVIVDYLFTRLTAASARSRPVVAIVDVGPGSAVSAQALTAVLDELSRTPWIRLIDPATAASMPPAGTVRLADGGAPRPAPAGYWSDVAAARARVEAFSLAAGGPSDAAVARAYADIYRAESAAWAGPDGAWALADRGRSFAAAANRAADAAFALRVSVPTVTLSSSTGRVPVSVVNDSGRTLRVRIASYSPVVSTPRTTTPATLKPGENILSVPVDLASSLSAPLRIDVRSGDLVLASGQATVRASYTDRLVMVGGVVLVLLLLLWYIRRKARSALTRRRVDADVENRESGDSP